MKVRVPHRTVTIPCPTDGSCKYSTGARKTQRQIGWQPLVPYFIVKRTDFFTVMISSRFVAQWSVCTHGSSPGSSHVLFSLV